MQLPKKLQPVTEKEILKEIADELGLKQHNVAAIARGELYNELHNYKTPMR